MRRSARLAAVGTAIALAASGCSRGSSIRSPRSEAALDAIAGRMTDMVTHNGIPIEGDYVRCQPSLDGRSADCHAQTATEPAKDIKGTFAVSTSATSAGCPGTLTVSVGPPISDFDVPGPVSRLAQAHLDPCR